MKRKVTFIYSNERNCWKKKQVSHSLQEQCDLELSKEEYQKMEGFGGCFNELGWLALSHLSMDQREEILEELFGSSGANINFCRLPIGANDYAIDWYSLDEVEGDYELEHFSIERDRGCLIQYIKSALRHNPDIKLFASPWSPPTWMKYPKVYNSGKLIWDPKILNAYALYLARFIQEYEKENVKINQIHVQNEPVADQKFPSCMWTGEELRDFIKMYLGPMFEKFNIDSEIWLGTINAPGCDYKRLIFDKFATEDYDYFANTVLMDPDARRYIKGVGYQWGGKFAIPRTFESWWPQIRLMQTENECGFGDNTWEYSLYNFTMMKHYINNGAEAYLYWNLVLLPRGTSTWGDDQNAMVTVDDKSGKVIYNPDFYLMKHFSSAVKRNAVRLSVKGPWAGDSLAFRNPDGDVVVVIMNPFKDKRMMTFKLEDVLYSFELEPRSFNTISFK
jgi:O-Glycosyl hydrolase